MQPMLHTVDTTQGDFGNACGKNEATTAVRHEQRTIHVYLGMMNLLQDFDRCIRR